MVGVAAPAAAQDAAAGAAVFKRSCALCHSVAPGKPSALGPNLRGVTGRKAGTTAFAYSPAMKKSGIVWTPDAIKAFLTNPRKIVPGTRMAFLGLPKPKDQADVAAYLKAN